MAYKKEYANKTSHFEIVNNKDVNEFLGNCDYITEPSQKEAEKVNSIFDEPERDNLPILPERIIAIDGSNYESSINDKIPSTKVGYVKIGSFLIDMQSFHSLRCMNNKYVDPFKIARLQENKSTVTFPLPSSNVIVKGKNSVRDSFRYEVDRQLYYYRIDPDNPSTSLRTTLFHLAANRPGGTPDKLFLHRCPNSVCNNKNIELLDIPEDQKCTSCNNLLYPSDCLRLWEDVTDFQSNQTAISRFMMYVEHILMMHYMRFLFEKSINALSKMAFFIDGPLAVFGTGAWLSNAIMRYIYNINKKIEEKGLQKPVIIGLQKTGQVSDYFNLVNRYITNNRLFLLKDDYRYKYIIPGREASSTGFGYETYYGQDFVYKTPSGRVFIFALPYPMESKNNPDVETFMEQKLKLENYNEIKRALALIDEFECDLYENAVVPVALAHRYTAISLEPGTRVLDLLTRGSFAQSK